MSDLCYICGPSSRKLWIDHSDEADRHSWSHIPATITMDMAFRKTRHQNALKGGVRPAKVDGGKSQSKIFSAVDHPQRPKGAGRSIQCQSLEERKSILTIFSRRCERTAQVRLHPRRGDGDFWQSWPSAGDLPRIGVRARSIFHLKCGCGSERA